MRNTINTDNIATYMLNTCDTLGCTAADLLTIDLKDGEVLDDHTVGDDSHAPTMREIIQYYQDHFGT